MKRNESIGFYVIMLMNVNSMLLALLTLFEKWMHLKHLRIQILSDKVEDPFLEDKREKKKQKDKTSRETRETKET